MADLHPPAKDLVRTIPGARTPRQPVNVRMARAGIFILYHGMSLAAALRKAGYAPSTARKPKANGLTANRCILEAQKLDPRADPRTLLASARRVALRALRKLETCPERDLDPARAVKLWDTAERYHGKHAAAGDDDAAGTRTFVQRAVMMQEVLTELSRRGLIVGQQAGHENADSQDR